MKCKNLLKRLLVIIIISSLFIFPQGYLAEPLEDSELNFKELVVQVMPQYVEPEGWEEGKPAVLVGQHGIFTYQGETSFEGEFRVSVPHQEPAFTLSLVGKFDEEGIVHEVDAELDEETGHLVWEPEEELEQGDEYRFVIEYYYDPYEETDPYQFFYNYELELPAETMSLLLFEPFGAEDFTMSEEADRETEMFGVLAHAYDSEDAEVGTTFNLDISYEKEDSVTTLEAMETQTPPDDDIHAQFRDDSSPEAAAGNGGTPLIDTESALMISLSIIIAGMFVFFGLRSRGSQVNVKEKSRSKAVHVDPEIDTKELRQKLIRGEIDEETYKKERSKRSS
ncbi:hypothetical protein CR194_09475 [Salipaludibacillus keqinensis]|uniref:SHOCT domain-containing protein n=1 Tax=Salipaludibacillus keqinensis TaxID=2045207 RepID=A0A323TLG7_9BACI|nr:hypothetical protein [Salipaludibacillus keqinensis]PYZ93403.1 hypothetical protein CR194_09475 [Salipaludibacillus keqinensis]